MTLLNNSYIVLGGADRNVGQFSFDVIHRFDSITSSWSKISLSGSPAPSKRYGHSAISYKNTIYVFGGKFEDIEENVIDYDDLWALDGELKAWTKIEVSGNCCARNSHSAVVIDDKMVVMGGANSDGPTNEVHIFDFGTKCWTKSDIVGSVCPSPREMHASVVFKGGMYMMGGRVEEGSASQELWKLEKKNALNTYEWKQLAVPPSPRCAHVSGVVEDLLIVYGGFDGEATIFDDIMMFDFDKNEWVDCELRGPPVGRLAVCACVDEGEEEGEEEREGGLVFFGGVNAACDLGDINVIRIVS